jgi:acid phosphatase (class A)
MNKILLAALVSLQLFTSASVVLAYDIPPPPVKGSAIDREDFRILHIYQNERTDEQCEAADRQTIPTVDAMFGPSTGILTASEVRKVNLEGTQLIRKVFKIVDPFKEEYMRMRPYNADPTLRPCVKKPGGNKAYPSAHSAVGIVLAAFLAQKFPAKKIELIEQGKQCGLNRVIGGVHHPSDVVAGQSLGKQIAEDLSEL